MFHDVCSLFVSKMTSGHTMMQLHQSVIAAAKLTLLASQHHHGIIRINEGGNKRQSELQSFSTAAQMFLPQSGEGRPSWRCCSSQPEASFNWSRWRWKPLDCLQDTVQRGDAVLYSAAGLPKLSLSSEQTHFGCCRSSQTAAEQLMNWARDE